MAAYDAYLAGDLTDVSYQPLEEPQLAATAS
jgi:hypothetical protein